MKCPRCGREMIMDGHRKIDMLMCYNCGYIEGRNTGDEESKKAISNFERLRTLDFNETVGFLSEGLHVDHRALMEWLERPSLNE